MSWHIPTTSQEAASRLSSNDTETLSRATRAIHADDALESSQDVAPPLHLSTTFQYPDNPEDLVPIRDYDIESHPPPVYSRWTAPNTTRLETVLSSLIGGHVLTYSSGLAAMHAALTFLNPKSYSIGDGYHGTRDVMRVQTKLTGMKVLSLDCDASELEAGDIVHLETPVNPSGEALSIEFYATKAHSRGAYLLVDSTFAPPTLQDPFMWGADVVMHSGTKYIGGHSDLLCGILAVKRKDWWQGLWEDRIALGSVMGNLEGWLAIRGIRTLELRITKQSDTAEKLVKWFDSHLQSDKNAKLSKDNDASVIRETILEVRHASLQHKDKTWLQKQMPNGCGPVFAIVLKSGDSAKRLPSKLSLFKHATSLGGVESLIEWRTMTDETVDERLVRLSIGLEDSEDLKKDLYEGLKAIARAKVE